MELEIEALEFPTATLGSIKLPNFDYPSLTSYTILISEDSMLQLLWKLLILWAHGGRCYGFGGLGCDHCWDFGGLRQVN